MSIGSTTELFSTLCDVYNGRGRSALSVQIGREPKLTIRYDVPDLNGKRQSVIPIDMDRAAWTRWGRRVTADWWAVTAPAVKTTIGTQETIEGHLLVWNPYKVWESEGIAIYHHAGPSRIYWMHHGLRSWEAISTVLGGSYAVVSDTPLTMLDQVWIRDMITVTRPGTWRLPAATQDSTTLTGATAINDCLPGGVASPMVDDTARWLRRILPSYKVGAPSIDDVRLKLDLERRLRIEDKVVGSARPLAFTLQAIEDTTFPWPGLWLVSGSLEDFRTDLPVLLAWDATLVAVAAATRLHVDVKPGLCYGGALSQSVLRSERRFSKRDVGATEGAYCQVNPTRIVGAAPVVATRLLQAATHELSHIVLRQLQPHSEIFAARREQLFLAASELLPALIELVQALGLDQRPSRAVPVAPVTLDQWLHENLIGVPAVSVPHLVQSWSAVRNLTEGRALRDVEDALTELAATGRYMWSSGDEFVINRDLAPAGL